MADTKSATNKIFKIKGPIVIRKNVSILKNSDDMLMKYNSSFKPLYREDVVFESADPKFTGNSHKLTVVNRLNVLTNSCRTIAKYVTASSAAVVKTSDNISRLIGQKNYDTVFTTLLSVIDQEQKIKAMTALLTVPNRTDSSCQTDVSDKFVKPIITTETCCQTDDTCTDILKRMKMKRKHNKRQKGMPYVVKDTEKKVKKLIINPEWCIDLKKDRDIKSEVDTEDKVKKDDRIPNIDEFVDDASVISTESLGNISLGAYSMASHNLDSMIDYITKSDDTLINPTHLKVLGGGRVTIHVKPEDIFHIATKDILKNVTNDEKKKLIQTQAYYDWKYCLVRMDDEHLVIHKAVINNDVHLLNRHCVMLKKLKGTVDVPTGDQLTPIQLSVMQNSNPEVTDALLQHGADPLQCDEEDRSLLHLAAEGATSHLALILDYCRQNARRILEEDEALWRKEYTNRSDEQLAIYLLRHMSQQCDNQGHTPLMVASRLARHENVAALVRAAPGSLDRQAASSGDTALYLAVAAACSDAVDRGNRCKVTDEFMKTIEILVENGANPAIDNYSGGNVNLLLQEFSMAELSMLVANKYTSQKYFDGSPFSMDRPFMLVKDNEGKIQIKTLPIKDKSVVQKEEKPMTIEKPIATDKPVILQNVQFDNDTDIKINKSENSKKKIVDRASNIVLKKIDKTAVPNLIKIESNSGKRKIVDQSSPSTSKIARKDDIKYNR